ncbi:serine/threonine protein kinase [Plantactinospora sonchi]|uniref:non-specific serine/threonine protein kinase n=1 Tax=Plantactinospora sonchi TaxID=1544735 RepID=A0ABU7RP26_9ACTN
MSSEPGHDELVPLGDGPVATVLAGVSGEPGEAYALKVYPGRLDRRTRARVRDELRRLGELRGIAPVLVADGLRELADGRAALRLELCAQSLPELLDSFGPLSGTDTVALGSALAAALAAAHRAGLVHGGVTPGNVLFRPSGEPLLADFGLTLRHAFPADPARNLDFLAPETVRDGSADERSDLYGLGAILHFALTGRPPHQGPPGEPPGERLLRVLGAPVPPVERADLPPGLPDLVSELLAKDPDHRPADAADVLARLAAFPVPSVPAPAPAGSDEVVAASTVPSPVPAGSAEVRATSSAPVPAQSAEVGGALSAPTTPSSAPTTPPPAPARTAEVGSAPSTVEADRPDNPPVPPVQVVATAPALPDGVTTRPSVSETETTVPADAAVDAEPAGAETGDDPPATVVDVVPHPGTELAVVSRPGNGPAAPRPRGEPILVFGSAEPPRRTHRTPLLIAAGGLSLLAVLSVLFFLNRPGELAVPPPPPSAAGTTGPAPTPATVVHLELTDPVDRGNVVELSWRSTEPLDFAVVVAEEGEQAKVLLAQRGTTYRVPVDPVRRYCFLIQGSNGLQVYETPPKPIRGARCVQ